MAQKSQIRATATLSVYQNHHNRLLKDMTPQPALAAIIAASAVVLSGCVMDKPRWNDNYSSTTTPIDFQTSTDHNKYPVLLECTTAFHGGLYPPFSSSYTWHQVASVNPTPRGGNSFEANIAATLPSQCWRQDSNNTHYAAVRARQMTKDGSEYKDFVTKQQDGSIAQYSGTNNPIPFAIIYVTN